MSPPAWKRLLHLAGEVTYFDYYRVGTGIDPVTKHELTQTEVNVAAAWVAAGYIPFTKLGKFVKVGKGKKVQKQVEADLNNSVPKGKGNFAGNINASNIPNMSKKEILDNLPSNWRYTEHNGFVHVRDANGNIRMRIDPPDKNTNYHHVHLYDERGNPLDINLNIVDRKSPAAHIPYNN